MRKQCTRKRKYTSLYNVAIIQDRSYIRGKQKSQSVICREARSDGGSWLEWLWMEAVPGRSSQWGVSARMPRERQLSPHLAFQISICTLSTSHPETDHDCLNFRPQNLQNPQRMWGVTWCFLSLQLTNSRMQRTSSSQTPSPTTQFLCSDPTETYIPHKKKFLKQLALSFYGFHYIYLCAFVCFAKKTNPLRGCCDGKLHEVWLIVKNADTSTNILWRFPSHSNTNPFIHLETTVNCKDEMTCYCWQFCHQPLFFIAVTRASCLYSGWRGRVKEEKF